MRSEGKEDKELNTGAAGGRIACSPPAGFDEAVGVSKVDAPALDILIAMFGPPEGSWSRSDLSTVLEQHRGNATLAIGFILGCKSDAPSEIIQRLQGATSGVEASEEVERTLLETECGKFLHPSPDTRARDAGRLKQINTGWSSPPVEHGAAGIGTEGSGAPQKEEAVPEIIPSDHPRFPLPNDRVLCNFGLTAIDEAVPSESERFGHGNHVQNACMGTSTPDEGRSGRGAFGAFASSAISGHSAQRDDRPAQLDEERSEQLLSAVLVEEEGGENDSPQAVLPYAEATPVRWAGRHSRAILLVSAWFLIAGVATAVAAVLTSRGDPLLEEQDDVSASFDLVLPTRTPFSAANATIAISTSTHAPAQISISPNNPTYTPTAIPSGDPTPFPTSSPTIVPTPSPTAFPNLWSLVGSKITGFEANENLGSFVELSQNGRILAVGGRSGSVSVYQLKGDGIEPGSDGKYEWNLLGGEILGSAIDQFGYSLALSTDGGTVAIGAPYNDETGLDAGSVHVYQLDAGVWAPMGNPIYGEEAGGMFGGSVSLSDDGNILAAGAYLHNDETGHVRVFALSEDTWGQLGQNIDGEEYCYGQFGWSLSLSGDGKILAVGANQMEDPWDHVGQVEVYKFTAEANSWQQLGQSISGEERLDQFGTSVSLSGDGNIVAAGAIGNDMAGEDAGHVRVYRYDGDSSWVAMGQDILGEAAGDRSGVSVSLTSDGRTLAVGAHFNNGNGNGGGGVRIFRFNESHWVQVGEDLDGVASGDRFGSSVSLTSAPDGLKVAVGAPFHTSGFRTENEGEVSVYRTD